MIWTKVVATEQVVRHSRFPGIVRKVEPHTLLMDFCLGVWKDEISLPMWGMIWRKKIVIITNKTGYKVEVPIRHLHRDVQEVGGYANVE